MHAATTRREVAVVSEQHPWDAIEELARALTAHEPGAKDFLSVVRPDDRLHYGSAVPSLVGQMVLDRRGLYVPVAAARPRVPLDQIKVFLTATDLFGGALSPQGIGEQLTKVPMNHAVAWAANLIGQMQHPSRPRRQVEADFIDKYFTPPLKTKTNNLLRDNTRVLLIPQALMALIKIALTVCPPPVSVDTEVEDSPLVSALLSLPEYLDSGAAELEGTEFIIGKNARALEQYFVANQLFNAHTDIRTALAVFQRCWRELPVELANHPRVLPMAQTYEDVVGVPLDDLVALCAVMWTRASTGQSTIPLSYFEPFGWSPERLKAVLGLVAATPDQMRQMLADDDAEGHGIEWSTKTFDQFPVVHWGDYLTVLDAELLMRRSTGVWPLYDVLRTLEGQANKQRASQVRSSYDHLCEEVAREALAGITGRDRLYDEAALRAAYGKKQRVADAAADYGHSWVVADITTTGLQLATAAGIDAASFDQDIDNIVKKARQIQATIDNVRADETKLTGMPAFAGRRTFYPVLVIATRFAASPITMTLLRDRLADAGVLQDPDIGPLEVMELEDLFAVEGAVEKHGLTMLDVLAEKATASMAMMSIREFLIEKLGHTAPHPERVNSRWDSWFDAAKNQLAPPDDPDAAIV